MSATLHKAIRLISKESGKSVTELKRLCLRVPGFKKRMLDGAERIEALRRYEKIANSHRTTLEQINAPVAQSEEQLTRLGHQLAHLLRSRALNENVGGSTPFVGTNPDPYFDRSLEAAMRLRKAPPWTFGS